VAFVVGCKTSEMDMPITDENEDRALHPVLGIFSFKLYCCVPELH